MKKDLFIVNGCSGAVGNACFALLARNPQNIVYGLSRKAINFQKFGNILPLKTLVCSLGDDITSEENILLFERSIEKGSFSSVNYIHAVGYYPFELNTEGKIQVENDIDNDGINDTCTKLTFNAFKTTCEILKKDCNFKALTFGSLADEFQPEVHQSWWKTMGKVRDYMRNTITENVSMNILNISSVLCFHELQTRPFVFKETDANPEFWLTPDEVAREVISVLIKAKGFSEQNFFIPASYYHKDYFTGDNFTERKRKELGL